MSSQSVIEAARALQPLISEHRRAGELRARLVPEVVAAVGKAGLFRLFAYPCSRISTMTRGTDRIILRQDRVFGPPAFPTPRLPRD